MISTYDAPVTQRPSRRSTSLARELAEAAYELHASVERQLHDTLIELELTVPLADALWQLDPRLGPLSRRQLAERLGCDPSNVTFIVDRLERRRLVTRARVGHDRRIKAMSLTASGLEARARLIATIARAPMWSQLTSAQRRQLAELLGRCTQLQESQRPDAR